MNEFNGKTVIVTGGAKGIGEAVTRAFAQAGADVFSADVDTEAGARIEAEGASLPGSITFVNADVSQAATCQALVQQAAGSGGVDVLVNNVGIQPVDSYLPAHEFPEETWDRILAVNLKSGFLMSKYTVPEMLKQGGGVIVNIASVQGRQSMKGVPAYAASKGGMISLTQQLALEYAEQNIRVLAVNPGTIETSLALESVNHDYVALRQSAADSHPIGRIGRPEEIAAVVLFLSSDAASFMTGEYVNVDGGIMAKGSWAE